MGSLGAAHAKRVNPSRGIPCHNRAMSQYPLVIRNRVAWFYRGFMAAWLGAGALSTYAALRDAPPGPGKWSPLIILGFWAVGLFGLAWSLNQQTSVVRITSNRSIHVERGKAFRREQLWTDHARFWIEDTKDSDGDPYFKLWMDAPGGKLTIKEGHHRPELEELKGMAKAAVAGRSLVK